MLMQRKYEAGFGVIFWAENPMIPIMHNLICYYGFIVFLCMCTTLQKMISYSMVVTAWHDDIYY